MRFIGTGGNKSSVIFPCLSFTPDALVRKGFVSQGMGQHSALN